MKKKKLAIFGSLKFGTGDYIAHLYPYLSKLFDVEVLSFSHMALDDLVVPEESELVFKTIPNPRLLLRPATFKSLAESYLKIDSFLRTFKPEFFNLHITAFIRVLHYFFYLLVDNLKKQGVKIIYTFHDVLHIGEKDLVNNKILTPFYNLADYAIVGNQTEKERLQNIFAFKEPITIGAHGVYDLFDQNIYNSVSARKKLKLGKEDFVILFFGILRENKGLDYLIKAISVLDNKKTLSKKIKLYIATTLRNRFELKSFYEDSVRKLNLQDAIILDIKEKLVFKLEMIEALFRACDVVALPYTHISQSGVLNLALGFKKPVIITDAFIEAKEVADKLGLVIPIKSEQKLAEAILKLVNNFDYFLSVFNKHQKKYWQKHNWGKLASQYSKICQTLSP